LKEVCVSHGSHIEAIGYHCRDYFLKQWDAFKHVPWGVLAHSTHVRGLGVFVDGVETCRAQVTLASQISPEKCRQINLGYRDPKKICPEEFANRERKACSWCQRRARCLPAQKSAQMAGGNSSAIKN